MRPNAFFSSSNVLCGRLQDLIFTTDPKQRLRIMRSLMSAQVFVVCVGLIAYGSFIGVMNPSHGVVLAIVIALSSTAFYVTLRSGFNLRFADPSLTLPQIVAALTWICAAYAVSNEGHGGTLILFALVLVFGIFNMNNRRARISTLYAVLAMGLTMAYKSITDPVHYPAGIEWMYFVFVATVMPMISKLAGQLTAMRTRLKAQKQDLESALARIQELASRDELTGLINRRQTIEVLTQHAARCKRGVVQFWVAVLDLDHFKQINDTWGHAVGDEVLRNFAQLAQGVLRDTDVIGRWGGEEFLAVMLAAPPHDPRVGIERLRARLVSATLSSTVPHLKVTFSAGLAAFGEQCDVQSAVDRADKAMYQAKANGRNCTVMDGG